MSVQEVINALTAIKRVSGWSGNEVADFDRAIYLIREFGERFELEERVEKSIQAVDKLDIRTKA